MQAAPEVVAGREEHQAQYQQESGRIDPARGRRGDDLQGGKGQPDPDQHHQGARRAEQIEQQQARDQAAGAVADDVGELHQADPLAQAIEIALHGLLHDREGEAHDERGGQHHNQQQDGDHRHVDGTTAHEVSVDEACRQHARADRPVDVPRAGERQRRGNALHQEEEPPRVCDAVDGAGADQQARRVAQQKNRQDQREAVAVGLQQHADQAVPDDLQRNDQRSR